MLMGVVIVMMCMSRVIVRVRVVIVVVMPVRRGRSMGIVQNAEKRQC